MGTVLVKPSGILGFKLDLFTVSQSKDCGEGVELCIRYSVCLR